MDWNNNNRLCVAERFTHYPFYILQSVSWWKVHSLPITHFTECVLLQGSLITHYTFYRVCHVERCTHYPLYIIVSVSCRRTHPLLIFHFTECVLVKSSPITHYTFFDKEQHTTRRHLHGTYSVGFPGVNVPTQAECLLTRLERLRRAPRSVREVVTRTAGSINKKMPTDDDLHCRWDAVHPFRSATTRSNG